MTSKRGHFVSPLISIGGGGILRGPQFPAFFPANVKDTIKMIFIVALPSIPPLRGCTENRIEAKGRGGETVRLIRGEGGGSA